VGVANLDGVGLRLVADRGRLDLGGDGRLLGRCGSLLRGCVCASGLDRGYRFGLRLN
jgi:hypothetical protein